MIINNNSLSKERVIAIGRKLRERGYRFTPQRQAIIQAVLERSDHPSAEEIYQQVLAVFPMISRATVYKTLEVLKELDEVVELPIEGRSRYDGNTQPHIHLICEKCHAIMDWDGDISSLISEAVLIASGFHPRRYYLEVYGLCSRCRAEGTP